MSETNAAVAFGEEVGGPVNLLEQHGSLIGIATDPAVAEVAPTQGKAFVSDCDAVGMLRMRNSGCCPNLSRHGYRSIKRLFDIIFAGAALAVLLIPSAVLCLAICLESPGASPIYTQYRVGRLRKDGSFRIFRMFKFRSMVPHAHGMVAQLQDKNEADGPLFKIKEDPRVTRIGKFIRRHSLDEMPQFINVFVGQIPLRIIKTGQGEPCEISGLFALPAKELRTQKALFPQVKVASGTCLRTVQNFFSNHTAQRAQTQRILTKRKFTHISWGGGFGGLTLCESWLLSYGTTSGLVN